MAVHKPIASASIYYITFIFFKWLHLIGKINAYEMSTSSFLIKTGKLFSSKQVKLPYTLRAYREFIGIMLEFEKREWKK